MKNFSLLVLKTHIALKTAIFNVLILVPFFFVYIYMFHYHFIEKIKTPLLGDIHFWFVVLLCLCLSVVWFYLCYSCAVLVCSFIKKELFDISVLNNMISMLALIESVVCLSIALFVRFYFSLSFFYFCCLIFVVGLVRFGYDLYRIKRDFNKTIL